MPGITQFGLDPEFKKRPSNLYYLGNYTTGMGVEAWSIMQHVEAVPLLNGTKVYLRYKEDGQDWGPVHVHHLQLSHAMIHNDDEGARKDFLLRLNMLCDHYKLRLEAAELGEILVISNKEPGKYIIDEFQRSDEYTEVTWRSQTAINCEVRDL